MNDDVVRLDDVSKTVGSHERDGIRVEFVFDYENTSGTVDDLPLGPVKSVSLTLNLNFSWRSVGFDVMNFREFSHDTVVRYLTQK